MKPLTWSRWLMTGAIVAVVVTIYCGGYAVFRLNGTLTHYYSTGEGHCILRSREYGLSPMFLVEVYAGNAEAQALLERNHRYLTLVETVFAPLRFIEARVHPDPQLREP